MSKDLHALIFSLTQSEKRYFKVYASRHVVGEKNNYVTLFDAINEQEEFNEGQILQRLQGEKWIATLPAAKNYLHRLILKSMRAYSSGKKEERKIRDLILDIHFLNEKSLTTQSEKLLRKALKLARSFELFHLELEILELEKLLLRAKADSRSHERIRSNEIEVTNSLKEFSEFLALCKIRDQLFDIARGKFGIRDESIDSHGVTNTYLPRLQKSIDSSSFRIRIKASNALALHFQIHGERSKSLHYYGRTIEEWDRNPRHIREKPNKYKIALANYLTALHLNGKFAEFPPVLGKIRSLPRMSRKEEIETLHNLYLYELLFHLNQGSLEDGLEIMPEITKFIDEEGERVNIARILTLSLNIVYLLWIYGDSESALKWTRTILDKSTARHRRDIIRLARILETIFHYELENYEMIEYYFRSHYRHLKRKSDLDQFEKLILRTLNKLPGKENKPKAISSLLKLQSQLSHLKEGAGNQHILGMQEIEYWLKAKIEGRTLRSVIYEQDSSADD